MGLSLRSLVPLTLGTLARVLRTRPKDWAEAINDDTIGPAARNAFVHGVLNEDNVTQLENCIATCSFEMALQLDSDDTVAETRQIVPADETIDVRDSSGNFPAVCRRWCDQEVTELHVSACEIQSNNLFGFSPERFASIMERRRDFPVRLERGCDREGYFGIKALRAIEQSLANDVNTLVKAPIGNLDYRARKYPWRLVNIQGHPRMRSIITAPAYDFDSYVQGVFENKVLAEQFGLTADQALSIGKNSGYEFLKGGGSEQVLHACHAYATAVDTGSCDYWGEFDLIGSGMVNGWWQLRSPQAIISADYSHADHVHPRTLFAEKLSNKLSLFATFEPTDVLYQKFLKLILSPLQYGAGAPGVFFALTGVKYDEDTEVDWELFRDVNELLQATYGTQDPSHSKKEAAIAARAFSDDVFSLAGSIASCYARCFPDLKDAETAVGDTFESELKKGNVPQFTSFSGGIMHGPVIKRLPTTHVCRGVRETATGSRTQDVWVSDKVIDPEKLRSAAFSWILHNIDAEIISLLVVRLHEAGIPCYTNHDAVFIPLWAYDKMQVIFAACIAEVNSHNILIDQFGCTPVSGTVPGFGSSPVVAT